MTSNTNRRGGLACKCPPETPCSICRAASVELLQELGMPEMALRYARELANCIREETGQAMWKEFMRGVDLGKVRARRQITGVVERAFEDGR